MIPNVFSVTSDDEGNFNVEYPQFFQEFGISETDYRRTLKQFSQTVSDYKSNRLMAWIIYAVVVGCWLMISFGLILLILPFPCIIFALIILIIIFIHHNQTMKKDFQKELSALAGKENRDFYLAKGLLLDFNFKPMTTSYYQEGGKTNTETVYGVELNFIVQRLPEAGSANPNNVNIVIDNPQASAPPMQPQPQQQQQMPPMQPQYQNMMAPPIIVHNHNNIVYNDPFNLVPKPMIVTSSPIGVPFSQPFQPSFVVM